MAVSSYCKKWAGQPRDCDLCPGPDMTEFGIERTCTCKCHKEKGKDK